jgi:hypothetical protein
MRIVGSWNAQSPAQSLNAAPVLASEVLLLLECNIIDPSLAPTGA